MRDHKTDAVSPGDKSRGPVNTRRATSGGVMPYVTPVIILLFVQH